MQSQFAALPLLLAAIAVAGCDQAHEPPPSQGSTTPAYERAEVRPLVPEELPVRIGELGPNFAACNAVGRFRERAVTEPVPVRAAPFEQARETARIAPGGQFFICTRSHDQRWFAIVWDAASGAGPSCGVSRPVSRGRDYAGPCKSGWIPSVLVRLESGIVEAGPSEANSSD
ncbi:MAG TPA: hypothetical protein VF702_12390 [Allosphingosinicella sp.]|jgi:hypothetical protein